MSDEFPFPPGLLEEALRTAGNSEAARNAELTKGFDTKTPYARGELDRTANARGTAWVVSANTGALYGIKLNPDLAEDGSVTGKLTHINGQALSEYWYRIMMVNRGYDGVKQTLKPAEDGTITVTPGWRGIA
jgi:hypothetical protein